MKRRVTSSSQENVGIKKKASSLFSIATLDERSQDDEQGDIVLCLPIALSSSPGPIDNDGFFIEDETENCQDVMKTFPFAEIQTFFIASHTKSEDNFVATVTLDVKPELGDFRTGLVVEDGSRHFDRNNRFHKERSQRIVSILEALKLDGTIKRCSVLNDESMKTYNSEKAFLNDDDYLRVHRPGYMRRLEKLSICNCDRLDNEAGQFQSIYLTQNSVKEAQRAADSLCRLVSAVVNDNLDNGFAIIRPPGHHAEPGLAGGYCILNNVAIAAAYARERLHVKRILIVDWDVHLGNGTQTIFHDDPNVMYFSVHRWHGGSFYPFSPKQGGPTYVGRGKGLGFTVNVGWTCKGMGDVEYLAVWDQILLPMAQEYQPELVLISAGFDAAAGDLGECNVSPSCFGQLTRSLMTFGRVVCTLEGGYVRSILGKCVNEVVRALLDRQSQAQVRRPDEGAIILDGIHPEAMKCIFETISAHKPYWKCLQSEN